MYYSSPHHSLTNPPTQKKQVLHAGDAHNAAPGPNDPNDLPTNIVRSGAMAGLALLKEGDEGKHVAYHYLRGRIGACECWCIMYVLYMHSYIYRY